MAPWHRPCRKACIHSVTVVKTEWISAWTKTWTVHSQWTTIRPKWKWNKELQPRCSLISYNLRRVAFTLCQLAHWTVKIFKINNVPLFRNSWKGFWEISAAQISHCHSFPRLIKNHSLSKIWTLRPGRHYKWCKKTMLVWQNCLPLHSQGKCKACGRLIGSEQPWKQPFNAPLLPTWAAVARILGRTLS